MTASENLKKLNIELPKAPDPVGAYVAFKKIGKLIFISGQLPIANDGKLVKGKIGKEFAKRAESFSMEILYFGPNKKKSKYKYIGNLKKMASMVDYLVITCTGGKKTEKLINAAVLQSMKKHSYLVNVSRGTIIDEKSLINCLQKKCIKGAALDGFLNETKIIKL